MSKQKHTKEAVGQFITGQTIGQLCAVMMNAVMRFGRNAKITKINVHESMFDDVLDQEHQTACRFKFDVEVEDKDSDEVVFSLCSTCKHYDADVEMCKMLKVGVEDTDHCTFGYEQKN